MVTTTHITYLFDPLCGWCYGASGALEQLAAQPDLSINLLATGLFAGENARPMDDQFASFAWSNDQRISSLSGQPFSDTYRHNILGNRTRLFDSGPATLALAAIALAASGQELKVLKAIQNARYVEGRDITDITVLSDILRGLGLKEVADGLATPSDTVLKAYRKQIENAQTQMYRLGVKGVPTLLVGSGAKRQAIGTDKLFGNMKALKKALTEI